VEEQKLDVLGYPDIEEIQFNRGQQLQFAAHDRAARNLNCPNTKGLPVKREARTVTGGRRRARAGRAPRAASRLHTVDRPDPAGDVAVINYTGASDGNPWRRWRPTRAACRAKEFLGGCPLEFVYPRLCRSDWERRRETGGPSPWISRPNFMTPELAGKSGLRVEVV